MATLLLARAIRKARRHPSDLARFAFADPEGHRLRPGDVHVELQDFLFDNSRAMIELPRDHGKSMQVCIRLAWELGNRPGLRIKIICSTEAVAAERGRYLREAIANNPRLRLVFPNLRPAQPWADTHFTIVRPGAAIGPSVTALGVGAGLTGTRADLLVCDDIVDVRAVRSHADRERVKTYYRENLVNLLEPDGRLWNVFTPWHQQDLNAELKQNGCYRHFRRAVGPNLEPVWPEQWPRERLEERRREIGDTAFARAYRLVCVAENELAIRPEWIQFWETEAEYLRTILAVDPAASSQSSADRSALVVLGQTDTNSIHCLSAIARRVAAPDLEALIAETDRIWNPDVIVFEANGPFRSLADMLRHSASFGGKLLPMTHVAPKADRIRAFGLPVQNGRFLLHGRCGRVSPDQQDLFDEMTTFPLGDHDDLLDAAAMGTAYLMSKPTPRIHGG